MSEQETRALVTRYLEAFNAGDHEAMLALVGEEVAHDPFDAEREIGRDKLRWRLGLFARHFDERLADIAVMVAPGGVRAAAEFTIRGTYRATADGLPQATGQSYVLPGGLFFEVDDGSITRISAYRNPATWRSALGRDG
ncbi:ketosteroid isomerase-related protein [Nitratireductor sp. ZSWI3]|uniref:ketosteroid isomerase-related protein n=1 Tax=Nitratireductor sp. ZSWI3 TaxID=2966359 RepID=UPI00214FFF89|nr:ketosteroid isomerase-related protein [Nitratireductor sp. ZSWI3]MCR4269083.1 nuclear transport factor 2 family protein [Nitratireductor sp. ZSWI3]